MKNIIILLLCFLMTSIYTFAEEFNINDISWFDMSKLDIDTDYLTRNSIYEDCEWWCFLYYLDTITYYYSKTNIIIYPDLDKTNYKWLSKDKLDSLLYLRENRISPVTNLYREIVSWEKDVNILENLVTTPDTQESISIYGRMFATEWVLNPELIRDEDWSVIWIWYIAYHMQYVGIPKEFYYKILMLSEWWNNYLEFEKKILELDSDKLDEIYNKIEKITWNDSQAMYSIVNDLIFKIWEELSTNLRFKSLINSIKNSIGLTKKK